MMNRAPDDVLVFVVTPAQVVRWGGLANIQYQFPDVRIVVQGDIPRTSP